MEGRAGGSWASFWASFSASFCAAGRAGEVSEEDGFVLCEVWGFSGEGIELYSFLAGFKARSLQIEHGPVPPACGHEFVMAAEFYHPAVLQDADAVGMTHGGEAMRDENGGDVASGGQDALEDLSFAAHVKLSGRLIEQDDAGACFHSARLHSTQCPRQSDALPLA